MKIRTNLNRAARLIAAAGKHKEEHHADGVCDLPGGFRDTGLRCPAERLYDEAKALLPPTVTAFTVTKEEYFAASIPSSPWSPEVRDYRDYYRAVELALRYRASIGRNEITTDEAITARTIFVDARIRKVFLEEFPETAKRIRAKYGGVGGQFAALTESHLQARGQEKLSRRFLKEIAAAADIAKCC